MTPEGSTHVDTAFTGTTSSFSGTASGKVAVVTVVRQRVFTEGTTRPGGTAGGHRVGRYLNKRYWISLAAGQEITPSLVEDLVAHSYELVGAAVPARRRPGTG